MDLLDAKTRAYDWGTTDAIAELQGRPVPAPGPEAELWMGAHPSAPSALHRPPPTPAIPIPPASPAPSTTPLPPDPVIAGYPVPLVAALSPARFGRRLPILL